MEPNWIDADLSSYYLSPYPNFRLFDKNSNEVTNFNFSKSEDNQSLQINFTPLRISQSVYLSTWREFWGKAWMVVSQPKLSALLMEDP